ncbi:murein hydrolase activator EnvC family protein [Pseudoclavibacter helvolus]|uniref:murein hydrolase activator EnvC family protein n=1 Tax=Pseudoclavibacter helvolus TaxID=255205 RepID=UPI000837D421|nr:M23 family metallopeptidase [Pseudoclavibacter helvolus]
MRHPPPLASTIARGARTLAMLLAVVLLCGLSQLSAPHASAATASSVGWQWPVESTPAVSRAFELASPYGAGHRGIDIVAAPGAVILAPAAGTVRFSGFVVDRPVLSIQHADGALTSYEPVVSELEPGAAVLAGQRIGVLSTGHRHSPEGSLHIGLRQDGAYRDPAPRFGALHPPAAVLLPLYR